MSTVNAWAMAKAAALNVLDPQKDVQYITSVTDFRQSLTGHKADRTIKASRDTAANAIAGGTHRPATPEEAAEYDKQENEAIAAHERMKPVPFTMENFAALTGNKKGDK